MTGEEAWEAACERSVQGHAPWIWTRAAIALALIGCAHEPGSSAALRIAEAERTSFRRVAVLASQTPLAAHPQTPDPRSLGDAATEGLKDGVLTGLSTCILGIEAILPCMVFPLIVAGFTLDRMSEVKPSPSSGAIRDLEGRARAGEMAVRLALRDAAAEALARSVRYEVQAYAGGKLLHPAESEIRLALAHGFDAVLEIELNQLDSYWIGRLLGVEMAIRVALATREEAESAPRLWRRYTARSALLPENDWTIDTMSAALGKLIDQLAKEAIEEAFLLVHMPGDRADAGRGYLLEPQRGLGQRRPRARSLMWGEPRRSSSEPPLPPTRWQQLRPRPLFRWERFEKRWSERPVVDAPLEDVLYDFRIYAAERDATRRWFAGPLIYEATGLSQPEHRPEIRLEPCAHYFWTARARFRTRGVTRVSEWMGPLRFESDAAELRDRWGLQRWGYAFLVSPRDARCVANAP